MNDFNKPVYKVPLTCKNCTHVAQCTIIHHVLAGKFPCVIQVCDLVMVEIEQPKPHLMVIPEDYEIWIERLRNFTKEHKQ